MVTTTQIKDGLAAYIDREILPKMSGVRQYGTAIYLTLALDNLEAEARKLINTQAIRMLGIADDAGNVDIDRVRDAAEKQMHNGRMELDVPLLGRFTFTPADVSELCETIKRA